MDALHRRAPRPCGWVMLLRAFDQAHDDEEYDGADCCHGDTPQESTASGGAKGTEQPPAKDGTDHTDNEIADEPKATALDQ